MMRGAVFTNELKSVDSMTILRRVNVGGTFIRVKAERRLFEFAMVLSIG